MTRTLGVVGNISRDLVSYPDGRRQVLLGGAALYVALAAVRAGMSAAPIAVIGDDLVADLRGRRLDHLDLSCVEVAAGSSCSFRLEYNQGGQLVSTICDFGVADQITPHALHVLGRHSLYHVCCRRPLDVRPILQRLVDQKLPFTVDFHLASAATVVPAVADLLPYTQALFVNRAEFAVLRTACNPQRLSAVVISDGPRPVVLLRHGRVRAEVRPPQTVVAEVTGAGDTLTGTFLATIEKNLVDTDALRMAVQAATIAVGATGVVISGH
jgi:sugar/nucleoside kinase (ribokinase family)